MNKQAFLPCAGTSGSPVRPAINGRGDLHGAKVWGTAAAPACAALRHGQLAAERDSGTASPAPVVGAEEAAEFAAAATPGGGLARRPRRQQAAVLQALDLMLDRRRAG